MSTPHNSAEKGDIAKTVLMPGDPLRAKFIAENFLENPVCYNQVRGMLGYTGTYRGVRISVQGSGMGMPSMAIYSYELFNEYDVDNIIRIGTAGALPDNVNIRDIVIAMSASTNSNYASQYGLSGTYAPTASYRLLSESQMQEWDRLAEHASGKSVLGQKAQLTGINLFVRLNANRMMVGEPLIMDAPASINSGTWEISSKSQGEK